MWDEESAVGVWIGGAVGTSKVRDADTVGRRNILSTALMGLVKVK